MLLDYKKEIVLHRCTLGLEEVKPQQQENCLLFLRFIVAVMETNFAAFHTRYIPVQLRRVECIYH